MWSCVSDTYWFAAYRRDRLSTWLVRIVDFLLAVTSRILSGTLSFGSCFTNTDNRLANLRHATQIAHIVANCPGASSKSAEASRSGGKRSAVRVSVPITVSACSLNRIRTAIARQRQRSRAGRSGWWSINDSAVSLSTFHGSEIILYTPPASPDFYFLTQENSQVLPKFESYRTLNCIAAQPALPPTLESAPST